MLSWISRGDWKSRLIRGQSDEHDILLMWLDKLHKFDRVMI